MILKDSDEWDGHMATGSDNNHTTVLVITLKNTIYMTIAISEL